MTASPCESLVNALANVFTMLTEYRGLEGAADSNTLFANWSKVKMLDHAMYIDVCEKVYRLGLMRKDEKTTTSAQLSEQFKKHKNDGDWLALNARNLLFVQPDDREPVHRGIHYKMVLVVTTARSGDESLTKLSRSEQYMKKAVDTLRADGYETTSARVIRLVYGKAGKTTKPVTQKHAGVATEYWFTAELQANPLLHMYVPTHVPYASMTEEQKAKLPAATRRAAEGDISKLDRIRTFDVVARWYSYAPGQVICVCRRHLSEGGESYHLRLVV